jgi:hypothetical protein
MNTDLSQVRFGEGVRWGKNERFKVCDEEILEKLLIPIPSEKIMLM